MWWRKPRWLPWTSHSAYSSAPYYTCLRRRSIHNDKIQIAVVGSGPAGCYTAKYLLSHFEKQKETYPRKSVDITILERLATPFGLIRSGIAPDHPEVKNVQNEFTSLFQKYHPQHVTTKNQEEEEEEDSTLVFRGNVPVGESHILTWIELKSLFHIVVFAYGCADADAPFQLQHDQSSLEGIFSAREFVAWYNGHPMYASTMNSKLQECLQSNTPKHVVIIGHGNVALDCARIIAKAGSTSPSVISSLERRDTETTPHKNTLWDTDITTQALNLLSNTFIESIHILGRRGHVQGAFTIKELRELMTLKDQGFDDVHFVVSSEELDQGINPSSQIELDSSKPKSRIDKLLREHVNDTTQRSVGNTRKKIVELRFLLNPKQFKPHPINKTRIGSVLCQRTHLQGPAGKQIAVEKENEFIEIPADLVLVSIGYRGLALLGMDEDMFDRQRGILYNEKGRVRGSTHHTGLYVVGWIKRGPTGIIGTNIPDAKETVQSIIEDIDSEDITTRRSVPGREGLDHLLTQRLVEFVDFNDYLVIEQKEKDPGRLRSTLQPREKIISTKEMLSIIGKERGVS